MGADLTMQFDQQQVLNELSQMALAAEKLNPLLDWAVTEAQEILRTDLTNILMYRPNDDEFLLRAGTGFKEDLVGKTTVNAENGSYAAFTMQSDEPVVIDNFGDEDRFERTKLLADQGVISGISVSIGDPDDPWGVFGTYDRDERRFTQDDITFVQSVSNVLATAIERQQKTEELETSKARFEALFEQSPDILLVHDDEGNIAEVNHQASEVLGYSQAELLEMTIWDIDPNADRPRSRSFWDSTDVSESVMFDSEHVCKDGSTIPVEIHVIRIEEQPGRFLAITRDISERRKRERELERRRNRLKLFMEALTHDIPNHLNIAAGHLELAREIGDEEHFELVESAHERIEVLIEDIQTLNQVGSQINELEWVELSDLVESSWRSCCPDDDGTSFEIESDGRIRADVSRLKQVFENLFWNARDHGGPAVTVKIGIIEDGFYIGDDGPGIPEEKQEEILEPGYTTAEGTHTGFGLAIVREVADAHGWSVNVCTGEDGGARFEFTDVQVEREL